MLFLCLLSFVVLTHSVDTDAVYDEIVKEAVQELQDEKFKSDWRDLINHHEWSDCSVSCGGGTKTKVVTYAFVLNRTVTKPCNTFSCLTFPMWRQLAVTYGKYTKVPTGLRGVTFDAFKESSYAGIPITETRDQWELDVDACAEDHFFLGLRHVFKQSGDKASWDRSTLLIYDVHGYIAGIQMEIPIGSDIQTRAGPPYFGPVVYAPNGKRYLTAYFIEPELICSREPRSNEAMLGNRLLFLISNQTKNGQFLDIPLKESYMNGNLWKKGGCVPGMGRHYFFNLQPDMDCETFVPIFLLYNNNNLNGFGWTVAGDEKLVSATGRFEHAPYTGLPIFFNPYIPWPKCLNVTSTWVTSQHVFFDADPQRNAC